MAIELTIGEQPVVDLRIEDDVGIDLGVAEQIVVKHYDADLYTGAYEVTPDFTETVLPTRNTVLTDNVEVKPIQVESVSNTAGGRTVYIGGILNYG